MTLQDSGSTISYSDIGLSQLLTTANFVGPIASIPTANQRKNVTRTYIDRQTDRNTDNFMLVSLAWITTGGMHVGILDYVGFRRVDHDRGMHVGVLNYVEWFQVRGLRPGVCTWVY